MLGWGQKVNGRKDPCYPCCCCRQGNSSWPCQLVPIRVVLLSFSPSPTACKLGVTLWVSSVRCVWGWEWAFSACGL